MVSIDSLMPLVVAWAYAYAGGSETKIAIAMAIAPAGTWLESMCAPCAPVKGWCNAKTARGRRFFRALWSKRACETSKGADHREQLD